jgi:hypothetical protein
MSVISFAPMFLQRQIEDNIHAHLPLVDLQIIVHEMIRVTAYLVCKQE